MPTDRVITIQVQELGDYNPAGVYQDGPSVDYTVWASLLDTSVTRVLEAGGARGDVDRAYRVRWFSALAVSRPSFVVITDHDGLRYTVTAIEEQTGRNAQIRRRWLELECSREALSGPPTNGNGNGNGGTDTTPDMMPDMMDMMGMMGGLMAAPTFTELASATEGATAGNQIAFSNHAAVNTAWNSGTYWAFLVDIQLPEAGSIEKQATAIIPIRRPITAALFAYFATNIDNAKSDRGYLHMASGTALIRFDDNSIPPNAVVKLYGVS